MQLNIIKAHTFQPKAWSGGLTTELFIYPLNAKYSSEGNFDFRISTATVEQEQTKFSQFRAGCSRTLLVLEGNMVLRHEGHHQCKLERMKVDRFLGNWTTYSEGKCKDFNLMIMNSQLAGTVEPLVLERGKEFIYKVSNHWKHLFMYVYSGGKLQVGEHMAERGDIIVFSAPFSASEVLHLLPVNEKCEIIVTAIFNASFKKSSKL